MPSAPKYLSTEERRAMAVKAVLELAAVLNPSVITTTGIAAHMGLSQGGLFRHFSSKEEIWQNVMEWVATELYTRVSRAAEATSSPLSALEAMFMTHVEFAIEHPGVPRILFGELQKPEQTQTKIIVGTLLEKYGKLLAVKLEQGKSSGEVDEDVFIPAAVSIFIGAVQGLIIKSLLISDIDQIRLCASETFVLFRRSLKKN